MPAKRNLLRILMAAVFIVGLTAILHTAGGGGSGAGDAAGFYDKGVQADKAGDYKTALDNFKKAQEIDRNNPDILNMLAHSQRKLGMIDEALDNYKRALKLRPNFPEAREYLGEAYIQAALREIETLKSYGKKGDEQREDLIKALKDAAQSVK